ncbi:hypothetical protein CH371_07315 [Leptospira wolffii]|uniref:Uncharacterized protein n=1 Tax=Leptospira wolffii TaxID=409998 RepID=A0A2M9ZH91_9LEPT|nr:hypothetical protein CH371_07315 [Leptospira wolffii]
MENFLNPILLGKIRTFSQVLRIDCDTEWFFRILLTNIGDRIFPIPLSPTTRKNGEPDRNESETECLVGTPSIPGGMIL